MYSKKWWNIYSFSKDTVWVFPFAIAIFLEVGRIGNLKSSESNVDTSVKEKNAPRQEAEDSLRKTKTSWS